MASLRSAGQGRGMSLASAENTDLQQAVVHPAPSGFPNPGQGAWKVSPAAEHALEKHQRKYTPPPPGKFALLKITALRSYFL